MNKSKKEKKLKTNQPFLEKKRVTLQENWKMKIVDWK